MEKRCPTCNRKYVEEDINYCLEDGSFLHNELPPEEAAPTARISNVPTEILRSAPTLINRKSLPQPRSNLTWLWVAIGAVLLIGLIVFIPTIFLIVRLAGKPTSESTNANYRSSNINKPVVSPTYSPLNLEGTAWAGTDSTGVKTEYYYLSSGGLRYTTNGSSYEGDNSRWRQSGDTVTMDLNNGYAHYDGVIKGDRIDFKASNKVDFHWTITVYRMK